MKNNLFILLLVLLSACASYKNEHTAILKDGEQVGRFNVTSGIDEELSSEYFLFLNITFANNEDDWIRVKKIHIPAEKIPSDLNFVLGEDLVSWSNSAKAKLAIDQYNKQMWLSGVSSALLVAGAAAGAKNPSTGAMIMIPALAGIGVTVANDIMNQVNNLERSKLVPPDHLYTPFSVAPGLFTKKWILLQGRGKQFPCEIPVVIEFIDGKKANFSMRTRYRNCEVN